jgi:hypothetical protein
MDAEEIKHWLKIAEVFLLASVKFLFAPFEAERYGFNFGQSFLITTSGGFVGIFAFYFAGANITNWWKKVTSAFKSVFLRRPAEAFNRLPPKNFTRSRRFIAWVKIRFGLFGIAFITPCIISIPIGTIIATDLFRKRKPVLLYLSASLLFWSLVLNGLAQWLQLSQYIPIKGH